MKTSPLAAALWGLNVVIVLGGGAFVVSSHYSYKEAREGIDDQIANYKPREAEKWAELAGKVQKDVTFSKFRLVPGDPEIPPPPKAGPGPGEQPTIREVDIATPMKALGEAAKKFLNDQKVFESGISSTVSMGGAASFVSGGQLLSVTYKVGEAGTKPGDPGTAWGNTFSQLEQGSDIIAMLRAALEGSRDGEARLAALPFDSCIFAEAIYTGGVPTDVMYHVSSAEFSKRLAEAERDSPKVIDRAVKDGLLTPDRKRAMLKVAIDSKAGIPAFALDNDDWLRDPTEIKRNPDGTAVKPIGSGDKKPDVQPDLPSPEKFSGAEAAAANAALTKSYLDEKTGVQHVGTEDMQASVIEDMGNYVETFMDAKGNAVGIKFRDNLPSDESNIARRFGAKPGDVVKSINDVPVKSMTDVRSVVGKQRQEGKEDFKVVYERNGVDQTKNIKAPPLKK